jgi:AraC-like DNA-binding protein
MKILISPEQKNDVGVSVPIPLTLSKYLSPFGKAEFFQGDFGNYLVQKNQAEDFCLYFFRFHIVEAVSLFPFTDEPVIALQYMLRGDIPCLFPGYGKKLLEEGHCEMFYLPAKEIEITLDKGIYELCWLELSSGLIAETADIYESIHRLCVSLERRALKSKPSVKTKVTLEVRNILKEIRSYGHSMRSERVNVLLYASIYRLVSAYEEAMQMQKHIASISISKSEEKLLQIRQYIIENTNIHECSLGNLCQKFHISEITLRLNFKKRFDMTISQYVQEQCMKRAKVMLYFDDDSIAGIADELGYDNLSNFKKAFKKYYKCSPIQMRNSISL